jgi:hypothetical protein
MTRGTPHGKPASDATSRTSAPAADRRCSSRSIFCSFEAAVPAAIYAGELHRATEEGRIKSVPYDRAQPVHTFWDLGHADATAIRFARPSASNSG